MSTMDRRLHDRALFLASTGLDFRLAHAEVIELEAHLGACPACARTVAALRADTVALRHPAAIIPPRRVDDAVYAAIAGHDPRAASMRLLVLVAATVLLLVALAGVAAAGTFLLRDRLVIDTAPLPSPPVAIVNPSPAASPAPSGGPALPADSLVAYVGVADGTRVVRTIRADGTDARTLAEGEAPAWSPDGTLIAFQCPPASASQDGLLDVCVMNADGTGQRTVVTGAWSPSWSPDGRQIMFSRSQIDSGDTWVADADGANPRRIGNGAGSWSPDGTSILLLGASGAAPDATVVRPDGSGARQLGDCGDAAWSPDGTHLACLGVNDGRGIIRVIGVADTSLSMLEEDAQVSKLIWVSADQIAYAMSGIGSSPGATDELLYLWHLRAREPRRQLMDLAVGGSMSASSDGTSLAVTVGTGGTTDVYAVSLGGDVRPLTTDGTSSAPRWQPIPRAESPAPSAAPAVAGRFADLAWIGSIHLASDEAGWVSTGTALYRTVDGGTTWTDVSTPIQYESLRSVAPTADTLYLVTPEPPTTIAATHDGGATWARVTIGGAGTSGSPILSFRAPDHGFATFVMNDEASLRVSETSDGGATWTGPVGARVPSGMELGGIQGPDGGVLWISNGKADNEPFDNRLVLSLDGGVTWLERQFPVGAAAPREELKWVEALWADGRGKVVMAISLGDGPQIYTSDDDGRTWRFVRSWRSFLSGTVTVGYRVELLSATDWVLVAQDGSGSWSTVDGGGTWRRMTGASRVLLDEVSVASPDIAWAVHRCDDHLQALMGPDPYCGDAGVKSVLLATSDGGRTWEPLGD